MSVILNYTDDKLNKLSQYQIEGVKVNKMKVIKLTSESSAGGYVWVG